MGERGVKPRGVALVSAGPLIAWIEAQLKAILDNPRYESNVEEHRFHNPAVNALADQLGVSARTLRRYRTGRDGDNRHVTHYRLDRVEAMLDHMGVHVTEVYPDLDLGDVEIEPDIYCPKCGDNVTPIEGRCPWCEQPARYGRRTVPRQHRLTEHQLRQLHYLHHYGRIPVADLAKQIYDQHDYASADSCAYAMRSAWRRMHLPIRTEQPWRNAA